MTKLDEIKRTTGPQNDVVIDNKNSTPNISANGSNSVFTQADANAFKDQGVTDLKESNAMYDAMLDNNETIKNETLDMIEANKNSQEEIINANTEFTIDQIEQQKEQAQKDYLKEQSGAYADYKKATSQHGVNAEKMASNGLTGSGYSESAQVAMYNQYQNRVSVAKSSYKQVISDYNNAITSARLQNNSALAELAIRTLEQRLSAIVSFVQQGNSLLMQKADAQYRIKQTAHSNYMDILKQIESAKQYDRSMKLNEDKWNWEKAKQYAEMTEESDGSPANAWLSKYFKSNKDENTSTGNSTNSNTGNSNKETDNEVEFDSQLLEKLGLGKIPAGLLKALIKFAKHGETISDFAENASGTGK
jgi:hypothetical protein